MHWQLSGVPMIRVDTSRGRLAGTHYMSTLAGGQRLVAVTEPGTPAGTQAFRVAEGDGSYTRYQKSGDTPGVWRAMTPDGTTHYFGEDSSSRDQGGAGSYGTEARWFLTRSVDEFGNTVLNGYQPVKGGAHNGTAGTVQVDIALVSIEYTSNIYAGVPAHARVEMQYDTAFPLQYDTAKYLCPGSQVPVGAQLDYRTGIRIYEGALRLRSVLVQVKSGTTWKPRRQVTLGYEDDAENQATRCGKMHAPLRVLTRIEEKAWNDAGVLVTAPTQTFTYGRRQHDFAGPLTTSPALTSGQLRLGKRESSEIKPGGYPTVDMMLMDLDGDGKTDLCARRPPPRAAAFSGAATAATAPSTPRRGWAFRPCPGPTEFRA